MTFHPIERAFVTLSGRQVHYRRAGSGPPLVILHQSPSHSGEFVPLMQKLAADFTVIAPDTPGYGLSDPIVAPDSAPEIDVFADALAGFFDGIGLERAGIYGFHTGASIGIRFAARYPERVAALVANGTMISTQRERADVLAHYLPPFVPCWDGGHLAWAWARLREQLIFFPWYQGEPSARVHYPVTLPRLQATAISLLMAGDNYRSGYHAALSYGPDEDIPALRPPARFICTKADPLYAHLDRMPGNAAIERPADPAAAEAFAHEFLLGHTGSAWTAGTPTLPAAQRITSQMIRVGASQLHVRSNQDGKGRPVVVLHDLGGSSRGLSALIGGFLGRRPVFAPDLPGHGDSDAPGPESGETTPLLAATLVQLGLDQFDLVAIGLSATIALELAGRMPGKVAALAICNPILVLPERIDEFERNYAPSLAPEWGGGHLLTAWHRARDQDLFWPWFDKSPGAALTAGAPAAPPVVQQRTIDLLKAMPSLGIAVSAAIRFPILERLRDCATRVHLFRAPATPKDGAFNTTGSVGRLPFRDIDWAAHLLAAFDR